ncbi:SsrA-binding protein [Tistlia consotensis]|uniref:SsrA-binding protein n=1 Tax=Tistlia consotensis USBA 355 TaxID=560819 RepID=A0A1Y6BPG4_9PROT|nr:SsrA-binding protein SmpB [Tistlia consotensis]SMF18409.1 SsrA-binding protein [Tistlia consotensis USBA 355]SNR39719.1 SsrA-binding protein [Tistlia consotensis]
MPPRKTVAQNRKATHEYFIEEHVEAGLQLMGSEVKSLRAGKASINEAYAGEHRGEIWLTNAHIAEYAPANRFGHDPKRPRKLLVNKRERDRLLGQVRREGYTLVPLSIYFNERGLAKLDLGLAKGKKKADKREATKQRDWQRQKARVMRERG